MAKSRQEYSSDAHCLRVESGRELFLVADIEELGKLDASEIHARRLVAKRITSEKGENFTFPVADGTAKLLGRDHGIRDSTLRQ